MDSHGDYEMADDRTNSQIMNKHKMCLFGLRASPALVSYPSNSVKKNKNFPVIVTARFARDAKNAEPRNGGFGLCELCVSRERSERAVEN